MAKNQVAECYEALLRPRQVDKQSSGDETHSLYVANVWSKTLKGTQYVNKRLRQRMNFFKQPVEMWECSWYVCYD